MALILKNKKNKSQAERNKKEEYKRRIRKDSGQGEYSRSLIPYSLPPSLSQERKASQMATFYPQYMQPSYSYPLVVTDWNTGIIPLPSPMYTPPLQQIPLAIVSPLQIPTIPQCPYTYLPEPLTLVSNVIPDVQIEPLFYTPEASPMNIRNEPPDTKDSLDPIELYLSLPKDLFPTARMLVLDPNPIIDEFCKMENVNDNSAWILDLEYGIPRVPVTRAIAIYDVKLNSVQCKNTPSAIHPGFESCSEEFKRIFLFYYDCIISTWYRGYMLLNCDKSVENFQSWLLLPMQILGMCWP